jgi:hypothetical protein
MRVCVAAMTMNRIVQTWFDFVISDLLDVMHVIACGGYSAGTERYLLGPMMLAGLVEAGLGVSDHRADLVMMHLADAVFDQILQTMSLLRGQPQHSSFIDLLRL